MNGNDNGIAVTLEDLHKSFGKQRVLNGITLTVARGETLAVLGRSGTGKSVLLKLIIGLQKADSGTVRVDGRDIGSLASDELNEIRRKIGFLFQEGALYDSLSIEENVAFPLQRHHPEMPVSEKKERVREILAKVGMDRDLHKLPAEISGGMKKRVGLARALALEPEIMLFDEPTSGLDPITATEIEDLILQIQQDDHKASIVVTHDLHGARTISNRLAILHEGNILIEGTFKDLEASQDPFVSKFLRDGS